jgi:hypothetical protein
MSGRPGGQLPFLSLIQYVSTAGHSTVSLSRTGREQSRPPPRPPATHHGCVLCVFAGRKSQVSAVVSRPRAHWCARSMRWGWRGKVEETVVGPIHEGHKAAECQVRRISRDYSCEEQDPAGFALDLVSDLCVLMLKQVDLGCTRVFLLSTWCPVPSSGNSSFYHMHLWCRVDTWWRDKDSIPSRSL